MTEAPALTALTAPDAEAAKAAANPLAGVSARAMRAELRNRAAQAKNRDVRANPVTKATGQAGNVHGRWVETSEYIRAAARFMRGALKRAEDGELDIADLAELATLADNADKVLREAARQLHAKGGHSWTEIGVAVGYAPEAARQCAWRRFGRTSRAAK